MAPKPIILAPREPLVEAGGRITQTWFRAFNNLFTNSGTVATPLTVQSSVFLNEATVSSGGTISSPDLPPGTLIGNGDTVAGPATTIDIDPSLRLSGETLGIAPLAAGTLMGNPGSDPATPGPVEIGQGLSLSASGTLAATGSSDDETLLYSIRDTRGEIAILQRQVNNAPTLARFWFGHA